jgi:hypothetical protein
VKTWDCKIKAATEELIYYDNKARQRSVKFEKYFIALGDNVPFRVDDDVKLISLDDFNKLGDIVRQLHEDKKSLQKQVEDLQSVIEIQNVNPGLKERIMRVIHEVL